MSPALLALLIASCTGPDPAPADPPSPDDTAPAGDDTSSDTADTSLPDACALTGADGASAAAPLLPASELLNGAEPDTPLDEAAFRPRDGAGDPLHAFSGALRFAPGDGQRTVHHAERWFTDDEIQAPPPAFEQNYTQCGRALLPVQRGRIQTDDEHWDLFLGPGQIWSNPADGGYSRIALPFALSLKWINCVQNGSMSFLFDGESVSEVRYQITQETCHLLQFDAWGQGEAGYTPDVGDDRARADAARDALLEERDRRPEVRDFAALSEDYPQVAVDHFDAGLTLGSLSARGLLVDGALYLDRCRTRYGDYSFCEEMVLPSFSLAKTVYTGLGMAALAAEFEPDPYSQTAGDLLGAPGSWGGVTLEDLIDMSTGHWFVDEQSDADVPGFYSSLDLAGRLDAVWGIPHKEDPGERVVYLTPNSQAAAAGMDAYLESVGAETTDSFAYLVDRVLEPAGVTPESLASLRTWEGGGANNGAAFGGYGMWFTPHGIAHLGAFIQRGGDGALHPDRLADTMFQTDDHGAPLDYYGYSYNNGMWGRPVHGCDAVAPVMFGVSGITVILAPNDTVYFTFNDAQEQPVNTVVTLLDQIAPLCE